MLLSAEGNLLVEFALYWLDLIDSCSHVNVEPESSGDKEVEYEIEILRRANCSFLKLECVKSWWNKKT